MPLPAGRGTVSFKETQVSFGLTSPHLPHFNYHHKDHKKVNNNEINTKKIKKKAMLKIVIENLEEIGEIGVIDATLRLKIGQILKLSADH